MTYVRINDIFYPATISGMLVDREWENRDSKSITLEMPYEEAISIFKDGLKWFIVVQPESYIDENGEEVTPEVVEYDNSDYCLSGPIVDHRNGALTVKMGKLTEVEVLQLQLANSVTEEELNEAYREGVNSL